MSATVATRVLIVKHTYYKVVGYLCGAFSVFCAVGAWRAGAGSAALVFLIFVALAIFILLNAGYMQTDSEWIRYYLPLRSYQIRWDEVRYIEIDSQGGNMVFVGENKTLATNGPVAWSGKDKKEMYQFIGAQIKTYGIDVRQTEKAMFRLSKNTRMAR